jgi:hypothetical protein
VVDEELSRAVVVFLRGSGLSWPRSSPEAVERELGPDNAERLLPRLRQLADEAVSWPVDWQVHPDLNIAVPVVRAAITEAHPELNDDAVSALVWNFSYCNK